MFAANTKADSHPRLFLTKDRVEQILAEAKTDPLMKSLVEELHTSAEEFVGLPPLEFVETSQESLIVARAARGRIIVCALQYLLTGDRKYADAAKRDMLTVCDFKTWLPWHFLGVAEMGSGVATGYDWIYDTLSEEERTKIEQTLKTNVLDYAPICYAPPEQAKKNIWNGFGGSVTATSNWNFVCNSGFMTVAEALKEVEPELAKSTIENAQRSVALAMDGYKPDGAWPESPTYWGYGTSYLTMMLALMQQNPDDVTEVGRSFANSTYLRKTLDYSLQVFGPTERAFNYGDGGLAASYELGLAAYEWLSTRFGTPFNQAIARERLKASLSAPPSAYENSLLPGARGSGAVFKMVWLPKAAGSLDDLASVPRDVRFRGGTELVLFRSKWQDPDALWLGIKAGTNGLSHGQLDLGSFVLEANGVRWAVDLGPDNYRLPGYWDMEQGKRWQYLRNNNLGHNTLTPGSLHQDGHATVPIIAFDSKPDKAFAIADLTAAYPGTAEKILRGFAMLDRSRILVQDEITGISTKEDWNWRMLTGANIKVADDGRSAILSKDGQQLRAEILSPAKAGFVVTDMTPPSEKENPNKGIKALVATATPDGTNLTIAVLLTPLGEKWAEKPAPSVASLQSWAGAKP